MSVKNFRKHMMNIHPCLVEMFDFLLEKINSKSSDGVKVLSVGTYDLGLDTDIIIDSANKISLIDLEKVRKTLIICYGIEGEISTRYYVKSYIDNNKVIFTSYNNMSGESISITFTADGKFSQSYDVLLNNN